MGASLLLLVVVGLIIPALSHSTVADRDITIERESSPAISFILFAIYIVILLYALKAHRHLFAGETHNASDLGEQPWTGRASITVLTTVICLVALMSNMLIGARSPAAQQLGLTQVFVHVILVVLVEEC